MGTCGRKSLADVLSDYYETRRLRYPRFSDAIKFAITEIGEACEVDLARYDWVRNNPATKRVYSPADLAEELGDAIMMLQVAGMSEGGDPLRSLLIKMSNKVGKDYKICMP